MAKGKRQEEYDLNKSFYDASGNAYRSFSTLEAWARFSLQGVEDLSNSVPTITTSGSPQLTEQKINGKSYRSLSQTSTELGNFRLGDASHWSSRIGPTGKSLKVSMSAWIHLTASPSSYFAIANLGGADVFFGINSEDKIWLQIDDTPPSGAATFKSSTALNQNVWYHVAFSYDLTNNSSVPKMYVNGEEIAVTTGTAQNADFAGISTQGLELGDNSTQPFQGHLSEICVWSSELGAKEVKAIYNTSVSKMHEIISGYITNPVKTIIRENDYKTGSYPSNLRTGDRDFRGNSTVGMLFDDTKSIDFVSPFPTAEIEIKAPGPDMHRSWIGLTSSVDTFTKNFEFVTANEGEIIVNSRGAELVLMGAQPAPGAGFTFLVNEPKIHTPTQLAEVMANAINKYSDDLDLVAKASGGKITLVSKVPGPFNSTLHGQIISGSEDFSKSDYKITQFSTTTQGKISYPALIPDVSQYANTNISTPSIGPDLKAFKETKPGLTDYGISFTPGENISPFNDERIFLGINEFYQTGTLPSVLKGFNAPLSSKTQIVMDFITTSSQPYGSPIFQLSPGDGTIGGSIHPHLAGLNGSGFAYWNDDLNKWEMLHSNKNPRSLSSEDRLGALRGFTQPNYRIDSNNQPYGAKSGDANAKIAKTISRFSSIGHPTNTSGFPFATQYAATGSQCIDMSKHISAPFLLEKMTVTFKGVLGTSYQHHPAFDKIESKTFFVLAQKTTKEKSYISGLETVDVTEKEGSSITSFNRVVNTSGHREVVGYGRIGLVHEDSIYKSKSTRDEYNNLRASFDKLIEYNDDSSDHNVTSSFTMELTPRLGLTAENIAYYALTGSGGSSNFPLISDSNGCAIVDSNAKGGANLRGEHSGRHLSVAMDVADLSPDDLTFSNGITGSPLIFRSEYSKDSPYLLFPEDKLIFGWENHHIVERVNPNSNAHRSSGGFSIAEESTDHIKEMKITLFGSLIRNDKEYHDTLNQPLTSDGIHETIYGAPVLDQWDVEPMTVLSGSTRDALFFGDMFSNSTQFASTKIQTRTSPSVNPEHTDSFTISVPESIGGEAGTPVTILFENNAGTGGANQIRIRRNANGALPNAANFASLLVHAINGTSPDGETRPDDSDPPGTFVAADVGFATSGNGQNGIPGITASKNNAASPSVIITADKPGAEGDRVTFTDTNGNFIATSKGASPAKLTGGGVAVRGRRGSIVAGHAGRTGSLGRNSQYFDSNVIYSDSRVSSIGTFLDLLIPTATASIAIIEDNVAFQEPRNIVALSNRETNPTSRILYINDLFERPLFEAALDPNPPLIQFDASESTGFNPQGIDVSYLSIGIEDADPQKADTETNPPLYKDFKGSVVDAKGANSFGDFSKEVSIGPVDEPLNLAAARPEIKDSGKNIFENTNKMLQQGLDGFVTNGQNFNANAIADSYRALYGTIYGLPNIDPNLFGGTRRFPGIFEGGIRIPYLTGFKFGFSNIFPTSPVYHFRRSSYGQLRDLIESPVEAKMHGLRDLADEDNGVFTADQDAKTPPVKIIFMSRAGEANIDPADTNSQNLSIFSTSSKPYFDDEVSRERDVVNFPPPDLTDRTSISEDVSTLIDPPGGG